MSFGQRLLSLRKEKGLSQDELGSQLNVSKQTVSKWELDETTPEMNKLILMNDFFNISLDKLVKGTTTLDINLKDTATSVVEMDKPKKGIYDIILLIVKIFGVIVLIDVIVMIIYFSLNGFPD